MNRRQFLATLGLGAASLIGITALMGVFTGEDKSTPSKSGLPGYGVQNYGP